MDFEPRKHITKYQKRRAERLNALRIAMRRQELSEASQRHFLSRGGDIWATERNTPSLPVVNVPLVEW